MNHNFIYDEEGSWLASLSKRRLDHFCIDFKYSKTIKTDSLDNYCLNSNVEQIDLLKSDVAGNEPDVIEGAVKMLADKKIKILSFKFGTCNLNFFTYFQDIFYFLNRRIFRITPSCYLRPI